MIGPSLNDWARTVLFLPRQGSTVAPAIDALHFWVIGTTMLGTTAISAAALYFVLRYRHRGEDLAAGRAQGNEPTPAWLEWLIAVGLFALFVTWWVVGFTQYVQLRVPPKDAYDVYVTAKQWMWQFSYAEGRHSLSTLYVPAGRPVRLLMTSRDVIHSFYVPEFRLKQDVLPGRYTELWFDAPNPGSYRVLCAEYCGTNHSTMRAEIVALAAADFAAWMASGDERAGLVRIGEGVAAQAGCLRCHTLDGRRHIGPSFAGLYRTTIRLADGKDVLADEAYLTESMMDPAVRIHEGYAAVMPSYLGRLQPGEVAAVVELIKSLATLPPGTAKTPPIAGDVEVGPDGPVPPRGGARP